MRLLKPIAARHPKVVDVDDRVAEPCWLTVHQPSEPDSFKIYPPFAGFRTDPTFGDHYVTLPEERYEEVSSILGKYNQRLSKAWFHTQQKWKSDTHGTIELFLATTPSDVALTSDLFDFKLESINDKFTDVWFYKLTDPALLACFEMHYCRPLERQSAWLVMVPKDTHSERDILRLDGELEALLQEILSKRVTSLRKRTYDLTAEGKRGTKEYVRFSRILRTLANSKNSKPVRAALLNAMLASLPSSLSGMFIYQRLLELKAKNGLDVDYSAYWSLFDPALGRKQFYQAMLERHVVKLEISRATGILFNEEV